MRLYITAPNKDMWNRVLKDYPEFRWVKKPGFADAWIPSPNGETVDDKSITKFRVLKYIVTPSTGTNHITTDKVPVLSLLDDREALSEIRASSEFTFLMILNALRRIDKHVTHTWDRDDDRVRGHELYGKLVGIVGAGRIGRNIQRWCHSFGAGILLYDPPAIGFEHGLGFVFEESDIIVISCSLTEETKGMIDVDLLKFCKEDAIIVNTARGEIIDEQSMLWFLRNNPNASYHTDVLAGEPEGICEKSPLLKQPNCVVTPHMAGTTYESQEKAARIALSLLRKEISRNGQ